MLGLLLRVAVGVVAAAAVATAVYTVYKYVNHRVLVEQAKRELLENDLFTQALKAKITDIDRSSGVVSLDVLDHFDDPVMDGIQVHGEEISSSIHRGQVILLDE